MPDASDPLAALARVHADRAIRRLAAIIDAPGTSTNARIAAARVLLSLAAGKSATARVNAANTILEWGHGKRGESTRDPGVVEKVIKVDWGRE